MNIGKPNPSPYCKQRAETDTWIPILACFLPVFKHLLCSRSWTWILAADSAQDTCTGPPLTKPNGLFLYLQANAVADSHGPLNSSGLCFPICKERHNYKMTTKIPSALTRVLWLKTPQLLCKSVSQSHASQVLLSQIQRAEKPAAAPRAQM